MQRINLYENKQKVATVPNNGENLLMLHETFKLQKVGNNKYRIKGIEQ